MESKQEEEQGGSVWCMGIISSALTLQIIVKAWFDQELSTVHLIHVECSLHHVLETLHITQQVRQWLDEHATQCGTVVMPTQRPH